LLSQLALASPFSPSILTTFTFNTPAEAAFCAASSSAAAFSVADVARVAVVAGGVVASATTFEMAPPASQFENPHCVLTSALLIYKRVSYVEV
jgi:hypothetical protein